MIRRNSNRPDYALFVIVLLDGGGQQPPHADAVGAHDYWVRSAFFIEEVGPEALGELGAELEDVPNLDAFNRGECRAAFRAAVAGLGVGDIGNRIDLEVAWIVDVLDVRIGLVGPGDEVGAQRYRYVSDALDALQSYR